MHSITVGKPAAPDLRRPIHLELYVQSAFDATNTEVNVSGAPTLDDACATLQRAVELRYGRPLAVVERSRVMMEVALAWNRRKADRAAALRETQQALHNPMAFR